MTTRCDQFEPVDTVVCPSPVSLFERCHWLYALCREYLFRDHTPEITSALFASGAPTNGTIILELGCGPGLYACHFARNFPQASTLGIDLSKRLIRRARKRAADLQLHNCIFLEGDAQALGELAHSVDAVIVSRLFLIVADREAVLSEIFRVLRPGGRCFIAEPTSRLSSRLPLNAMWLFARVTSLPWEKLRKPHKVVVIPPAEFGELIWKQPWASVAVVRDNGYQYAVCKKRQVSFDESHRPAKTA